MAMSALLSRVSKSSPSSGYIAMPMLQEVGRERPSQANGSAVAAQDLLARSPRPRALADSPEQDEELVPTLTADGVLEANAAAQTLAERAEQIVPDRVAERVVDGLEPVEVEEEQRDATAVLRASGRRPARTARSGGSGWAARERVMVGHELDAGLRGLPRRDVAEHADVMREPALAIANRRHAQPRGEGSLERRRIVTSPSQRPAASSDSRMQEKNSGS